GSIPSDPMTGSNSTWLVVMEDPAKSADHNEPGIFDVHSGSDGVSQTARYADWWPGQALAVAFCSGPRTLRIVLQKLPLGRSTLDQSCRIHVSNPRDSDHYIAARLARGGLQTLLTKLQPTAAGATARPVS